MSTQQRIAVLGAGPMGLAVAYQLAKDGHQPVVFEADDRIGGMTASFDFAGTTIERYYHFHCLSDHAFLAMLDELNIADKMHWTETQMGYWYQGKVQPWGNPMALLRFKGLGLVAKFRYGLHAFLATKRNDWQALDQLEATAWIKKNVGDEAYEVLWRRLFDYKFYDEAQSLSAAWIWSRIRRIGRSRYNLFREKLGYLTGGSSTLLNAVQAAIESYGGDIRLSSAVEQVTKLGKGDDGAYRLLVNGQALTFDKVISTIPLPYVPKVFADLPEQRLAQYTALKNVAVVCVIAKLAKPLTENFWLNTNDDNMDIPGLVEYTNLRSIEDSPNTHIVYVPFYMPAEHPKFADSDAVFLDKVKRYLMAVNPEVQDKDFLAMRASRYRFAQPVCGPNFLAQLPSINAADNLWIADTSYYYPEDRGISESIDFGRQLARQAVSES